MTALDKYSTSELVMSFIQRKDSSGRLSEFSMLLGACDVIATLASSD